ncbi:MbtH-like protein [Actinoalloteichus hoggarensis]|uniref:MbtH-like protein n=2 Tax=Actinoalloteichus hoggarensis TaxID=1470176 RepID=A0A221VZG4_9PSEU|nr:MbtH-like protein [Actinoalloteichus hoggarensis]
MTDFFADPASRVRVLVDDAGRHALWPARAPVPPGWLIGMAEGTPAECRDHVVAHWSGPVVGGEPACPVEGAAR